MSSSVTRERTGRRQEEGGKKTGRGWGEDGKKTRKNV